MARSKNRPAAARSAAQAAPDPAPAPSTAPAPGSPAAAVHAALAANPGATVTVIAGAAATSKPAARTALLAMETAGTATRVKGTKPGSPDTWTLTGPAPDGTSPAPDPQTGQAGQPGEDPAGSPDGPGQDNTAGGTGPGGAAETGDDPAPRDGDGAAAGPRTAGPRTAESGPGEQDDDAAPSSSGSPDPDDGGAPADQADPADSGGEAGDAPDPALITDLTERLTQIKAAADAAVTVLAGGTDLRAALAGLDEIYEQAAQARRSLKRAIGGTKAPAVRPGGLRDKVLAHLDAHPGKQFTPHEIHKVLGHSSGAIANALDTLVKLGDAELATEKPRRFRRAPAKPATPAAGTADSAQEEEGTELAGAA